MQVSIPLTLNLFTILKSTTREMPIILVLHLKIQTPTTINRKSVKTQMKALTKKKTISSLSPSRNRTQCSSSNSKPMASNCLSLHFAQTHHRILQYLCPHTQNNKQNQLRLRENIPVMMKAATLTLNPRTSTSTLLFPLNMLPPPPVTKTKRLLKDSLAVISPRSFLLPLSSSSRWLNPRHLDVDKWHLLICSALNPQALVSLHRKN